MRKSLNFIFSVKPKQPIFVVGFINKNEFVLGFYPFCLQIRWGY